MTTAARFDLSLVPESEIRAELERRREAAIRAAEAPVEVDGHLWYVTPHHVIRTDIALGPEIEKVSCLQTDDGREIAIDAIRGIVRGTASMEGGQPYIPGQYRRLVQMSDSVTIERGMAHCRRRGELVAVVAVLREGSSARGAIPVANGLA